jgi:DNA-binding Lrp family transcriptional regulator
MSAEARKKWWFHMPSSFPCDSLLWKQTGKAVRLYLYFRSFANRESGILLRKYETIAEHLGISPKTTKRWMDTLRKHGYIKTTRLSHGFKIEIIDYKSIVKNKSDKSDQSWLERVGTFDQVNGLFEDGDRTFSQSLDTSDQSLNSEYIKENDQSLDTSDRSKESIKESIKEIQQWFDDDWDKYPNPAGNKDNAFVSYKNIIGPDPTRLRPQFLAKMDEYVSSVNDPQYLKHGEKFFREWQAIEVSPIAKQSSGPKYKSQADHNSASSGETVF